jgi:DNA repair photolyase
MTSVADFRRLVISPRAERTPLGQELVAAFSTNACEVRRRPEDELDDAATVGSLICGYRPAGGWIERAEHGSLTVRPYEYYINPIAGCRARCTYCFLQASSARMPLRVYVGVESLFAAVRDLLATLPHGIDPLLCTGERADSLADSTIYPVGALLVEEVARLGRGTLELRTKSAAVDSLLDLRHRGRTVVAFSLSPQAAVARFEGGTASADARLVAARRCQEAGYRVSLKLEPLHIGPEWDERYRQLIYRAAEILDPAAISHVTVGSLRASSGLLRKSTFRRHHGEAVRAADFIAYRPSSINAMPPLSDRLAAYRYIREMLLEARIRAPIWWSMETPEAIDALGSTDSTVSMALTGNAV